MQYFVMTTVSPNSQMSTTNGVLAERPRRILLANAKGGCGKSTLATNLASCYASQNIAVALVDYDPQASASQWLKRRPETLNPIYGIEAFKQGTSGATGNWFMRIPREVQRVIVDTPAGLHGSEFQDQIQQADVILVPVLPSPIDIQSATRFIGSILLSKEYRKSATPKQLAVLANRTRKNTKVLHKLDLFLNSLRLPRVADIRDTQQYVHCSESGSGVIDIPGARFEDDRQHWQTLRNWLEEQFRAMSPAPGSDGQSTKESTNPYREIG